MRDIPTVLDVESTSEAACPRQHEMSIHIDILQSSTYDDNMMDATTITAAATSPDPADGLRAIVALRRLADRLEAQHVAAARNSGWSWQQIGDALGVSRQAVHKKHGG